MVFGTRPVQCFNFNLGGHKIYICTDFEYLGVILAEIGTSTKQRNLILSKLGRQCMFFSNEFVIFIFQLICSCIYFNHVILPIALYGCEIWGFKNSQIIENVHNDFLRQMINLRRSTPI